MAAQLIDNNTIIPENPIKQGKTWQATATFGGSISSIASIVFALTLKRGTETILELTEAGGHLVHTSTTVLTIKLTDEQTALLSKGAVSGELIGTSGGDVFPYFTLSTYIK